MLASHYRSPVNYSLESLNSAKAALERFYIALRDFPEAEVIASSEFEERFHAAMSDDFNTSAAIAVLFDIVREINRLRAENALSEAARLAATLRKLAKTLGLLEQKPAEFLHR